MIDAYLAKTSQSQKAEIVYVAYLKLSTQSVNKLPTPLHFTYPIYLAWLLSSNDFVVHKAEYETDAGRPAYVEKDRNAK